MIAPRSLISSLPLEMGVTEPEDCTGEELR